MPTRQAEEIAIRDLLAGMCAPHFGHGGRRESIRPEFVGPAGGSEQEQPVGSRLRNPRSSRQLGTNTDHTEFGNAARRPTLVCRCREPLHRGGVMLVFGYKQGDEDVHVEKTNHDRTLFGTAVGEAAHVLG